MDRRPRLESIVQKELSEILARELHNKGIGFPCLSEVRLNEDYSLARCYVSFLGSKRPQENLEELRKLKGLARSLLAKRMSLYKVPDLQFLLDDTFEKAESLEKTLQEEEKAIASFHKDGTEE